MNHDATVTSYFEAAGDLLAAGLANLKRGDPKAYQAVHEAVAAGALLTLTTAVGCTGIVETRCLIAIGDEEITIFSIDGRSPSVN